MQHMHPSMHSIYKQNTSCRHRGEHGIIILSIYVSFICCLTSRNLVTQLQDVINKLTSSQHHQMQPMSIHPLSEGNPKAFVIPEAPGPEDEDNYPDVQYWCEQDWVRHTERQKDHG